MSNSLSSLVSTLTEKEKNEVDNLLKEIGFRWKLNARENQLIPDEDFITWVILAGRGFGKTRTGAETIRQWQEDNPIIHLVGPTASDVRDVMIEGPSGILNVFPKRDKPDYEPSKRKVTFQNGSYALLFSAEEPDRLRGPQCFKAWADELCAWKYAEETWDQLQFGLRLGSNPQSIVTTTPRPIKTLKTLIKQPSTTITKGSTYDNKANLAPAFLNTIISKYEGTRLGRQELNAEILEDVEGALWKMDLIEKYRVTEAPPLKRIVIPIDPAVTSDINSDETGIVPVGVGYDDHFYVLDDVSGVFTPSQWATRAINAYHNLKADRIIGEANNGGDMIEAVLRNYDSSIPYRKVHATRGKVLRAEPIVALYELGRVHHVGAFPALETQMTTWDATLGEKSPDRMDSLVWGLTELYSKKKFGIS